MPAVRLLATADAVFLTSAMVFASARGFPAWPQTTSDVLSLSISVAGALELMTFAVIALVVFRAAGLYEAVHVRRRGRELARITLATAVVAAVMFLEARAYALDRTAVLTFWMTGAAGVIAARTAHMRVTRGRAQCRRALIVGSGPQALRVCRDLSSDPATPYRVLGFIDTPNGAFVSRSRFVTRRTVGTFDELEGILVREHVDEVHIGLPIRSHYLQIQDTIRVCERVGVKLMYRADVFDTVLARPQVDRTSSRVALGVVTEGFPVVLKRTIDVAVAAALLIALSPLLIATGMAIAATSPGPILFSQQRYGLNRRRFRMLKFRTMVENADSLQVTLEAQNEAHGPVFKIARDPRITQVGRILRRTSIDELPQLINVLRGEMSLVGPRPLPLRDVANFTRAADMRRFSVRPGLTGLWQVSGRSHRDFDNWIRLDLLYIDRWSLRLDFRILARTIPAVIRGVGAA